MALPEWVIKQKKKGYEIKEIRGKYYMYQLKSKWDPARKKAKKVTGEYIGVVTPEGIIPKKLRVERDTPIFSVEFGASSFLAGISMDLLEALKERFEPDVAENIWVMSILRLISPCPFKRIAHRYESSWISRFVPRLSLSAASDRKSVV